MNPTNAKRTALAVLLGGSLLASLSGQTRPAIPPASPVKEEQISTLEKVEVTASKVDGLIAKSLLPTTEDAPLYYEVIDRTEIERLGVTSIEELFRYIPQMSSPVTSLQAPPNNINVSGGTVDNVSRVGLRGFNQSQTVILINGRALPRSGTAQTSGTDISRIPLAAIERIEILPESGSALYGAGAIGGAINVILRRNYAGKEITTYTGTSWDGGATEIKVTYLDGRSFNHGRTSLTTTFDYQHRGALRQSQRDYLGRVLDKYGISTPYRNAAGVSAFELFTLPAFAGAPATIRLTATTGDLGIPGAAGARFAAIPRGTSAAQSNQFTPASFTATANQANLGSRFQRTTLYEPVDNYNLTSQLEHTFIPEKLHGYIELSLGLQRKNYSYPQSGTNIALSATDPLNPFRTGVTPGFVGRAVTVFLDPIDVPDPSLLIERERARLVVGLKGKTWRDWEWSLDVAGDYAHSVASSNNPTNSLSTLLTRGAPGGAAAVAGTAPLEVRRAVYPLLADHIQYPLSRADADKYFNSIRYSGNSTRNLDTNIHVAGDLYKLPAGALQAKVRGQNVFFDRVGGQSFRGSDALTQLTTGTNFIDSFSSNPNKRRTFAWAVESVAPVISKKWRPIPIEALDLNAAYRRNTEYSQFISPSSGAYANNTKNSGTSVLSAKLTLVRDVAVRASATKGFYPPDWNDYGDPVSEFPSFILATDAARNNETLPLGSFTVRNGGNPNLLPETSQSKSYGLILKPRFAKGLSLNFDYWRTVKANAIVLIDSATMLTRPDDFPGRITRDPLTPADQAAGFKVGRVTHVDQTRNNVGVTVTSGIDTQIRYDLPTARWGQFLLSANSSFVNKFSTQQIPGRPFINTVGSNSGQSPLKWRGRGSVTWQRSVYSATLTARYTDHYSTNTTAPSQAFPAAFNWDGGRIPAFMRYDGQFSYEVPFATRLAGERWWKRAMVGTKWTLGVINLLNDQPSLVTNGTSFYNTYDDPRQRFVYLQVKKSL